MRYTKLAPVWTPHCDCATWRCPPPPLPRRSRLPRVICSGRALDLPWHMALASADGQQAGQHGGGSVALAQVPLGLWPYSALGGYLGTVLLQQQSQAYPEGAVLRPQAARQVASLLAGGQGDSPGRGVGAALPDGGEQQDGGALRTKARHAAKHQVRHTTQAPPRFVSGGAKCRLRGRLSPPCAHRAAHGVATPPLVSPPGVTPALRGPTACGEAAAKQDQRSAPAAPGRPASRPRPGGQHRRLPGGAAGLCDPAAGAGGREARPGAAVRHG